MSRLTLSDMDICDDHETFCTQEICPCPFLIGLRSRNKYFHFFCQIFWWVLSWVFEIWIRPDLQIWNFSKLSKWWIERITQIKLHVFELFGSSVNDFMLNFSINFDSVISFPIWVSFLWYFKLIFLIQLIFKIIAIIEVVIYMMPNAYFLKDVSNFLLK